MKSWHWLGAAFLALGVLRLLSQWHWHEERHERHRMSPEMRRRFGEETAR